ncbi:ribose-5-phosphate isomerase [Tractidigestivibacter scatoligenes]|jgi:ribose 5-phosphate isomerase B|uniref:Ribose-5-phosphate isomerase n=1 Tax=Tractidigestivibacter scatoligenes TaxID=1299998 RepID=A0A100YWW3_TRASO|nr:RpiB/LacA/LacB family sugar-phosphate isomerase [Tractidigestivibacter scatoligenes]KUH59160.1 ribose-5-phosphate isomerase [Tractidigestivibacter scatoligenes]
MKIAIGSDEAGFSLKEQLKGYLTSKGQEIIDVGCYSTDPVLYPDIAEAACEKIVSGEAERAVLVCGTGIGMAITANKIPGIRAAVGHDAYSVERSVCSNDCQVITFGARIVSYVYVTRMLDEWLGLEFAGGGSAPKVREIAEVESRHAGEAVR